jgi:putative ABC transport system ATP-binding protein
LGPAVVATGLAKQYGRGETQVHALRGVDVAVPEGQFLCVMGPSGSGKSTLLHLLAGLDRPSAGSVRIGSTELDRLSEDDSARFRRRTIGLVFQFFNLVPSLNVEENVALPLLLEGFRLAQVRERIDPLLGFFGIDHRRSHAPATLSGGEMQRVALARALLDSKAGEEVLALLRRACDERGVTTILVTHDLRAASYADRIVVLRDGRIEDDLPAHRPGPPS